MASTSVRISEPARKVLQSMAKQEGQSMQSILEKAVEHYRREQVLLQTNKAFSQLKQKKNEWHQELKERATWETTLADGMDKR